MQESQLNSEHVALAVVEDTSTPNPASAVRQFPSTKTGDGRVVGVESTMTSSPSASRTQSALRPTAYGKEKSCQSYEESDFEHVFQKATKSRTVSVCSEASTAKSAQGSCRSSSVSRSLTGGDRVHPMLERKELLSCVQLLDAEKLALLPKPLPRAQEVPQEFIRTPKVGDQVISVSHAWRNQAHPDPTCTKHEALQQLLETRSGILGASDGVLLFVDFVSIPQRPFLCGQEQRTAEELEQFQAALGCMHEVFLFSDRIIHLPWEDSTVEEEGVEHLLPASALLGADFAQLSDCVQVCSLGRRASAGEEGGARLFDQVVAIDGQPVTTVEQAEALLGSRAQSVTVRRYPFGLSNPIPADARGWIFLERFITMVKCAMMDKETAKNVVISPCEKIFQQIMEGADRLRQASLEGLRDRESGELRKVLDSFVEEMQSKHFSGASTDKRELQKEASMSGDKVIVHDLMKMFTKHLAEHWDQEAAKQRSFAKRLGEVMAEADKMLRDWHHFSDEYAARLTAASQKKNPWPVVLLFLLPSLPSLAFLLFPYAPLDEPGGWRSQLSFVAFGYPMESLQHYVAFPLLFAVTTRVQATWSVLRRYLVWLLCALTVHSLFQVFVAELWGVYPVPLLGQFQAAFFLVPMMLCLWVVVPPEQRASMEFRWRAVYAVAGFGGIIGIFGPGFVFVNSALTRLSEGWQATLVLFYIGAKLSFEGIAVKLSPRLGADSTPLLSYTAISCYQVNLCIALSAVSSWIIVIEQICFDIIENMYHLWSLWRQDSQEAGAAAAKQHQYIVASLVLREFVEICVPCNFLLIYRLVRQMQPQSSSLMCGRSEEEKDLSIRFVEADIVVNLVITVLTFSVLWLRGYAPLQLLRGIIATRFWIFLTASFSVFAFYMCLQHAHFGMDMSFKFLWVADKNAQWVCGEEWKITS